MDCNHEWNLEPEKYSYSLEPKCKLCGEREGVWLRDQVTLLAAQAEKLEEQLESIVITYAKKCEDGEGSYYEIGDIVTDSFDEAVSLIAAIRREQA